MLLSTLVSTSAIDRTSSDWGVLGSCRYASGGPTPVAWNSTPKELGDLFILHKNRRTARAVICTSQWGWEMQLLVGSQLEVVQTQVCRSQDEVFDTGEQWRAAMIEKGWR